MIGAGVIGLAIAWRARPAWASHAGAGGGPAGQGRDPCAAAGMLAPVTEANFGERGAARAESRGRAPLPALRRGARERDRRRDRLPADRHADGRARPRPGRGDCGGCTSSSSRWRSRGGMAERPGVPAAGARALATCRRRDTVVPRPSGHPAVADACPRAGVRAGRRRAALVTRRSRSCCGRASESTECCLTPASESPPSTCGRGGLAVGAARRTPRRRARAGAAREGPDHAASLSDRRHLSPAESCARPRSTSCRGRTGELVVGATVEERGPDTTVTAGGVFELLRAAYEALPGITELELVETTAGLRARRRRTTGRSSGRARSMASCGRPATGATASCWPE